MELNEQIFLDIQIDLEAKNDDKDNQIQMPVKVILPIQP